MLNFKEKVIDILESEVDSLSRDEFSALIETPPSYDMGDY